MKIDLNFCALVMDCPYGFVESNVEHLGGSHGFFGSVLVPRCKGAAKGLGITNILKRQSKLNHAVGLSLNNLFPLHGAHYLF